MLTDELRVVCVYLCRNFQAHDNKVLHVPLVKITQVLLPKHYSSLIQTLLCSDFVHKCEFKKIFYGHVS